MSLPDLKNRFLGTWSIQREITGSQSGIFKGTAQFSAYDENKLYYQEQGLLSTPNTDPFLCQRSYWYDFNLGNQLRVLFEDGRHFLTLRFDEEGLSKDKHSCGQDHYETCYRFVSATHLSIEYWVKGPEKNYSISSQLSRGGASPKLFLVSLPLGG